MDISICRKYIQKHNVHEEIEDLPSFWSPFMILLNDLAFVGACLETVYH
jgi:hypothetical protein